MSARNLCDHQITFNNKTIVEYFEILTESQRNILLKLILNLFRLQNSAILTILRKKGINLFMMFILQSMIHPLADHRRTMKKTPETCSDLSDLTPLQRDIYYQILQFQRLEKMNQKVNADDRNAYLKKFTWDYCVLTADQKQKLKEFLIEYHDLFAKHRFDVGCNTELKIKLTPSNPLPVYEQGLPATIHLRDEILIELALLQYYKKTTTLSRSKYSSPIIAHRKPSGQYAYS